MTTKGVRGESEAIRSPIPTVRPEVGPRNFVHTMRGSNGAHREVAYRPPSVSLSQLGEN
jgi:hypothetical protein